MIMIAGRPQQAVHAGGDDRHAAPLRVFFIYSASDIVERDIVGLIGQYRFSASIRHNSA